MYVMVVSVSEIVFLVSENKEGGGVKKVPNLHDVILE